MRYLAGYGNLAGYMEARPLLELLELAQEREELAKRERVLSQSSGALLRRAREAAGLGVGELAQAADVSSAYLSQIESGKKSVSSDRLRSFHEAIAAHATTSKGSHGKGKQRGKRAASARQ